MALLHMNVTQIKRSKGQSVIAAAAYRAVEKAERGKNAQLTYNFNVALQDELSLDENIALARQFLLEHFVSRGMVVDFAVHVPDRSPRGIPNPASMLCHPSVP